MNPPLSRADKAVGVGTLLLLGLAGYWLGQPQQPFPAPVTVAETHPAEPQPIAPVDTLPTPPAPPAPPAQPEPRPQPAKWRVVSSPASRRLLQVHRYVGTIGGQPATAELQWYTPDSVTGRFYLHRGGPAYSLSYERRKPATAVLAVTAEDNQSGPGRWRLLTRPGGAFLRATWQQGKQRRRVVLRESYAGAVRYSQRTMLLDASPGEGTISCDFLRLSAPASVAPALRPLLNPGPKARLQRLHDLIDGPANVNHRLEVRLNGFGLFSYQVWGHSREVPGLPQWDVYGQLLDLNRGRVIAVASQFRRGYELELRRLISRRVLHGPEFDQQDRDYWQNKWANPDLADFPDLNMCLTETGLAVVYQDWMYPETVLIPYLELRPLVRPGTPLARMLRARGMW